MSLGNVKVGDKLYVVTYLGTGHRIDTVERITKTLVVTNKSRYRIKDGRETQGWMPDWARPATDEAIAHIRYQELVFECRSIPFQNLSTAQLESILEIANQRKV